MASWEKSQPVLQDGSSKKPKGKDALQLQWECNYRADSWSPPCLGVTDSEGTPDRAHLAVRDIWGLLTVHQVQDEAEFVRRVESVGHADDEGTVLEWTDRN